MPYREKNMSKLKKIMGTGAVVTALFAASITAINQPTLALSQTVQSSLISRGSTPVGNTAWQPYSLGGSFTPGQGIFVDVDTSSSGFTTTPIYITSLGGTAYHWGTIGATSIYLPTPTGFRVYIRFPDGSSLTPAFANQNGWHINWIAVPR
jgi:hypothetical protein